MKMERNLFEKIAPYSADVLDPFIFRQKLTVFDKVKVAMLTVTLLPVRVFLIIIVLLFGWLVSFITLKGLPKEEEENEKPISGWRREYAKPFIVSVCRFAFAIAGWNWIAQKGERASAKEAPILLLVPHTSFLDTVSLSALGYPCLVVKDSTRNVPIFSSLIKYTQPVYVKRHDSSSCLSTIQEIQKRVKSEDNWDQIVIFPEGTCGNRQALLDFKKGAFYPGVPIQPVFIRHPNRLDTITWTWDGPGVLHQCWLSLCQFHIYCELEFLPVYRPSDREKENAYLFSKNIRQYISQHVGIQVSNFSLEDIKYLNLVTQKMLPRTVGLVKLLKMRRKLGYETMDVTSELANMMCVTLEESLCNLNDFGRYLNSSVSEALKDFFYLLDQEEKGIIDGRVYIAGLWLLNFKIDEWQRLKNAFQVFNKEGLVTETQFAAIVLLWKGIPSSLSNEIFHALNTECREKEIKYRNFHDFIMKNSLFAGDLTHDPKGKNRHNVKNGISQNHTKNS